MAKSSFSYGFVIIILLFTLTCSCQRNCWRYQTNSMGTSWQVVICSQEWVDTMLVIAMINSKLSEMDSLWSSFNEHSEVNLLARHAGTGIWTEVNEKTLDLLYKAKLMYMRSDGVFDITVGPLTKRWRSSFAKKQLPLPDLIKSEKLLVNSDSLLISTNGLVYLSQKGMQIDLGGIAKGYAVDVLFEELLKLGYLRILVDGGGDLRVGKSPFFQNGWTILVEDIGKVVVENMALASSGGSIRYMNLEGNTYQHHINPEDGKAVKQKPAVTIKAKKCWEADALSTMAVINQDLVKKERIIKLEMFNDYH